MEQIKAGDIQVLISDGIASRQLLNPNISSTESITITETYVQPSFGKAQHIHQFSEQIYYVTNGSAKVVLKNNEIISVNTGDVLYFKKNELHGVINDSKDEFVYISINIPPSD